MVGKGSENLSLAGDFRIFLPEMGVCMGFL